ncbi:LPS export ABC transporter periplasmic protein LptC [Idiomarina tyrosinivorans]|uniref:Lipopolysaccharide export system protein LptC n=1 Tax=Idiomarina tyrosinivorans TaxID=1445662 RepID=A0A432ZQ91_9GAMM|nr:LPS export ABC transporter periplasmic protein LptC [Idiomarina tyrosinivorans]RUO80115.1 LPS export ABC transporter periplasmic protein LptC [Idiomarina tyrosinivorans]
MNKRVIALLIILFAIGALLFWRPFSSPDAPTKQKNLAAMRPDFTAHGMKSRIYEPNGRLAHQLQAKLMKHYSQIGLTELRSPRYTAYPEDEAIRWTVTAEQGSFYDDKTLVLEHNVNITSVSPDGVKQVINTDYLIIDLLSETMNTEYPLTVESARYTIRGEGMRADLAAQTMEIKRHVETVFLPRR